MPRSFTLKDLCLPLAIAAGLFIVFGTANIQGPLASGDHGRDLYAFERTLHGDLPYRDYWWVYGPLMPLYYAGFMKLYGVSILSVLAGKAVLKFTAGLFIYLALARLAGPAAALFGAIWFYLFSQDFFYTYDHAGGIVCITAIAALLMTYIKDRSMPALWAAGLTAFVLGAIKLNFGIAGLVTIGLSVLTTDHAHGLKASPEKKMFYRVLLIYLPLLTAALYIFLLRGLTMAEVRQCMPYASTDHPYNTMPWNAAINFWNLFTKKFLTSTLDFSFGCIVITALIRVAYLAWTERLKSREDHQLLLAAAIICFYFVLNFHEYLSSGTWYSSLWSQPLAFLFFFTVIALAIRQTGRGTRLIVWLLIAALCFAGWRDHARIIAQVRVPSQYLEHPKAKVFVMNNGGWIKGVMDTTDYLKNNMLPGDALFALPYDPLYYYLTGRKSPTQLLIFFEHINIKTEQEEQVIADLEKNHVKWVVVSSRMKTAEPGLGSLGQTYCPLIAKYLNTVFTPVAEFGNWQQDAGWATNHGTVILRRRE